MILPIGYYSFSGLVNFLASFGLCLFVYFKNKKSVLNRAFAFFCLAVAQWSLFYFLCFRTETPETADFLLRTCMIGVIFMPSSFTHFIIHLLGLRVNKIFIWGNYLISLLLAASVYSPLFAHSGGSFLVFPYWAKPGVFFPLHLLHFAVNVLYSHYKMHEALRKGNSKSSKSQVKYVFIGTSIGYIAGVMNYFCWYRIPVPPFLNMAVAVYVVMVAYAIVVHHLMDIEVVIKKAVVFASLLAIVYGIFVGVTLIVQELVAGGKGVGLFVSSLIIALTVGPIKDFLVNATDRFLFQKKYNPLQMIHDFSQAVLTELDLGKISKQTVEILSDALRIESCAVFIPNKEGSKFILTESHGLQNNDVCIDEKAPLITKLTTAHWVMGQECEIKQLKAVVCIGIFMRKSLIGILALGQKKSSDDYTKDDISVLNILADALGVAMTNAFAYEELRHKANLVTIGTLASGIKHDISKPIDRMSAEASEFLVRLKKDSFKDAAQALHEAGNLIERCCDTFQQVIAISDTYAAKPKEKEKPVALDVLEQIDISLGPLQNKLKEKGITVTKQIPDNLPKIVYDKDFMRQILDNIIGNAIDAIEAAKRSTEESKIIIRAREIENRTLNVQLEIADTGTGIPQKIRDKIFKPWFTTKGDKGTGLGLSLVSELVLRGGGIIDVESEEGKGTTFILGLKGVRKPLPKI